MDGPKLESKRTLDKGADAASEPETSTRLDYAKVHGDKLALLEQLLVEGKETRAPLLGSHAIHAEVTLSTHELVTSAVTGSSNREVEAAQSLDVFEKKDLIERTLQIRPNLSIGEMRAACEILDIDPRPFVDRMVEVKTEKFFEQIEQDRLANEPDNVIRTIEYHPEEDIKRIQELFRNRYGHTVAEHVAPLFPREGDILQLMIALEGRARTRQEELDRLVSEVSFEGTAQGKRRLRFLQRKDLDLETAEAALERARALLPEENAEFDELFEGGEDEAFYAALAEAKAALKRARRNRSSSSGGPIVTASIFLAAFASGILVYVGLTEKASIVALVSACVFVWLWVRASTRAAAIRERILRDLRGKRLNASQRRAALRAGQLKSP